MNILITGGLGFVGSALANRLCHDHDVTVMSRSDLGRARLKLPGRVQVRVQPLENIAAVDVAGTDLVIHCASTVDNYNILTDPYLDVQTNCLGTIALLEACKAHQPRFLFISTYGVYGNLRQLPANETSRCDPIGPYTATKLCAEEFCRIYSRLYDFQLNICRLTNVYGPGDRYDNTKKGAFHYLIWRAMTGEPINIYRGGDFIRDYVYIDDVVDATITVVTQAPAGELYLVGSGDAVRFGDLIDIVHRETGWRSIVGSMAPPRFHDIVGIVDFSADISKMRSLGWAPRIGYEEGIRRTIASYRAQLPAASTRNAG
ncbi:MAG: NAD-dependent epimerase/dehydratase family protein [Gemmatimonadales bacterium]